MENQLKVEIKKIHKAIDAYKKDDPTHKPLISETSPVAEVLCSEGLSDAVFTEEYGVLSLRTPEGWLLWHSCKVDGITLADLLKEAGENLKKLKETQDI